jgi:hypothetical protein
MLILNTICPLQVTGLDATKNSWNILFRVLNILNPANATKKNVLLGVILVWRNDSRAIDEVDPLHQGDVLPHLGLTRDRSHSADLLLPKSVDDGRLAGVGVSDKTDRNLFPVGVQG